MSYRTASHGAISAWTGDTLQFKFSVWFRRDPITNNIERVKLLWRFALFCSRMVCSISFLVHGLRQPEF